MALGTAGAACDPAPRYDSPQSPYVGVTYAEGSIVTTGDTQAISILSDRLGDNGVTLSLPAGAYPPGTRVTLRWVSDLGLTGSDVDQLDQFGSWNCRDYSDVAAQVLPPAPPPASPLTLTLPATDPTSYDILHANECDAVWQVAGTVQAVDLGSYPLWASFEIASPGLWTLGQKPDGGPTPPVARPEAGCRDPSDGEVE